ncbi:MAG TPA: relaxase domain-containing protein [Verrucomicrobiae bacterium]|nr:relaxase domain-containing protein [Verrucomicrobiae bacterium]
MSQNDYYTADEIHPGQWTGVSAERLGLSGQVTREQFYALCENQHPQTGDQLTLRQNATDERRIFFDFTCSAPKSVSVLAVTMNDQRLVVAHEEAANADCPLRLSLRISQWNCLPCPKYGVQLNRRRDVQPVFVFLMMAVLVAFNLQMTDVPSGYWLPAVDAEKN